MKRARPLLPAIIWLGWMIGSETALLACNLPARPGTERHVHFKLDQRESMILFDADARLHTFTGIASKLSGRVRLPTASPFTEAEACLQIDASSLSTGIDLRDERMRRSHLHTDRFPTILFSMSGVEHTEPLDHDRYSATVHGTLTLHGVTRPLMAPATVRTSSTWIEVEGQVPLHLSDFQIPIPSFLFIRMKDEVMVRFRVKAVRE